MKFLLEVNCLQLKIKSRSLRIERGCVFVKARLFRRVLLARDTDETPRYH